MSKWNLRKTSLLLTMTLIFAGSSGDAAENTAGPKFFQETIQPILAKKCYDCHGPEQQSGEVRFDTLDPTFRAEAAAETWHDALNRLNLGEMPPPDAPKLSVEERRVLVKWMTDGVRRAAEAKRYHEGRVVMRRLTRYEYQNTMRDLLGVDLDYAKELPPEPASPEGFLNNGAILEMSPVQLEAYLRAARKGLREAIVSGEQPKIYRHQAEKTAVGKLPNRKIKGQVPAQPEFLIDLSEFPRQGAFEIRIRAGAVLTEGDDYPRLQLWLGCVPGIVHVPRKLVGEVEVTAPADDPQTFIFRGRMEDYPQPGDRPFGNVDFNGMIGLIDFVDANGKQLRYPDRSYVVPRNKKNKKKSKEPPAKDESKPAAAEPRLDIVIKSVEFQAPVFESWPPKSHTRILFASEIAQEDPRYLNQVFQRFMTRAFRRPVKETELANTIALFERIQAQTPSWEEALRETLASVLVSPHFLYIVETRSQSKAAEPLSDYELATRLSYFLWSTMPDETLTTLAQAGKLRDPATLQQEVKRMLADPRSEAFITRFADQWFNLSELERVAVNPEYYPDFQEELKTEMRKQTHAFLEEILRADLSSLLKNSLSESKKNVCDSNAWETP